MEMMHLYFSQARVSVNNNKILIVSVSSARSHLLVFLNLVFYFLVLFSRLLLLVSLLGLTAAPHRLVRTIQ